MQITCECQRYFIETGEKTKNDKNKTMAIDVRKMHIHGNFLFTDYYLISLVKRKAGNLYSVKHKIKDERPWWEKPTYKMKKEGTYTREQFLKWLGGRIENPLAMVVELETCPPDNLAKAA